MRDGNRATRACCFQSPSPTSCSVHCLQGVDGYNIDYKIYESFGSLLVTSQFANISNVELFVSPISGC